MIDRSEQRAQEWFLSDDKDRVRGYLQATQARALNALLGLQARNGVTGSLAEIGVFLGKTLIGMARASRPNEQVLGVDPLVIGKQDLLPELSNNLRSHLAEGELSRVMVRRLLSTQLGIADWMGSLKAPARFIHLDGHHARETMLHDLQLASSWLQKGAVVVIDDFLNELHPDLTSGIFDGLEAHPQLEPVAVIPRMGHIEEGGSKLVCATCDHAAAYRDALDRALADHLRPWTDRMLGREVRVYRSSLPSKAAKPRSADLPAPPAARPLPIVFALEDRDGSYWLNTAVAITSVAQYATRPITIHVLHDDSLEEATRQRLTEIGRQIGVPLTLTSVELPASVDLSRLRQFGPASLFRLLIPQVFSDEPLVVYLDSDLVANGLDVTSLVSEIPADAAVSAVKDPYIAVPKSHANALRSLGLDAAEYVNSGVIAFRPGLIGGSLPDSFAAFSEAHPAAIHPDQDFLNLHFKSRIHFLDERFNYHAGLYDRRLLKPLHEYQGKILHYSGKIKPLDGSLGPAIIPFLVHAYLIPELMGGKLYKATRYLLPHESDPNAVNVKSVGEVGVAKSAGR